MASANEIGASSTISGHPGPRTTTAAWPGVNAGVSHPVWSIGAEQPYSGRLLCPFGPVKLTTPREMKELRLLFDSSFWLALYDSNATKKANAAELASMLIHDKQRIAARLNHTTDLVLLEVAHVMHKGSRTVTETCC
eukprot:TRINITY_DN59532_c0_g1_i1.p1 TRINITY_DN59532_c0_g1~~TRINITY_DN59532_c0_g1_i1.p1  ORF type:complete len:137 (-),score=11.93 TRINITY_DN59532_c0_g1_i1:376-786(-)